MNELRRKLEDARTEYRTAKYDGDLATDVLGETERRANPWTAARLRWFMPALVSAMAAMLAVVLWQRHWNASSTPTPKMVNTHPKPEPKAHITLVLDRFPDVEPIVQDVRSSMKQAVDELATGMDRAKPLIRGGVESVRGAAD